MSKSFTSWLMTVGLLVSVVAGVGYLAQPVALPTPFGIDVLLAICMGSGAFWLGGVSDRLAGHIRKSLARRLAERRKRTELSRLQTDWAASEKRALQIAAERLERTTTGNG
jgi:hypothetical protein